MRMDGVEHWDHFHDETIYWLDLSDMPEEIQASAREIDGEEYNERCFGMCVVHDLSANEYVVVTDSSDPANADSNIFYVDNEGDKHWFRADLPEAFVKEVFSACEDSRTGKLLPQGYRVRSSVLFDDGTGYIIGENQAAKSAFVTWQLHGEHGRPQYYNPRFHADWESAEQDLNSRTEKYKQVHAIREVNGSFAYLYPYSKEDARCQNELDKWEDSFRANVSCARDIEAAIRDHSDDEGDLQPGVAQSVLDKWGFKRVRFVFANTLRELGIFKEQFSTANRIWQRGVYVPEDYSSRYFELDTAIVSLDQFITQAREAYEKLELFGPEHCEPGSYEKLDYEGRVLVLSPDTLKESCWSQQNQLWLAHDGFGCSPDAIGRSIRCTCLGDGEQTRWNRTDFVGALKEAYLPQWAAESLNKLAEGEAQAPSQGGMTMQ